MQETIDAFTKEYGNVSRFMEAFPELVDLKKNIRTRTARTPRSVLYREHSLTVYRYDDARPRFATPLLVVPSLVNRAHIMDMLPHESFVSGMLERGFAVYLVDWGEPNLGQEENSFHDYVQGYIGRAVRRVLRDTGAAQVLLAGYCLGGTMTTLHTAIDDDERIAALITMVTPINFHDKGMLSWWAKPEHFDVDRVVNAFGNVPAQFFSNVFPWLVPTGGMKKIRTVYENHHDLKFMESFLAVDDWVGDNVPFPGQAYREVIRHGYQENVLIANKSWPLGRRTARLEDIKVPILNLVAKQDHVSPCDSCRVLGDLVGSTDVTTNVYETGHLGIALGKDKVGKHTPKYWDDIAAWAKERVS